MLPEQPAGRRGTDKNSEWKWEEDGEGVMEVCARKIANEREN